MVQGRNFEDRDFGFFFKGHYLCSTNLFRRFCMSHARARWRARAHVPFFVHSSMCGISFPGKMTMLDTFLTFKLIFKQSMRLTSAFFGWARAHTCPKRFITERGVQGRNFEDRDFGFFPKVIICAQLTYSGGFVCPTRARGGARARTYHFFSQ